ncbi:MAG: hypothetical protein HFF44_03820 [Lawsonibacter sp.]|nr:hypothetical protein [Lawsonibacter sp.]
MLLALLGQGDVDALSGLGLARLGDIAVIVGLGRGVFGRSGSIDFDRDTILILAGGSPALSSGAVLIFHRLRFLHLDLNTGIGDTGLSLSSHIAFLSKSGDLEHPDTHDHREGQCEGALQSFFLHSLYFLSLQIRMQSIRRPGWHVVVVWPPDSGFPHFAGGNGDLAPY